MVASFAAESLADFTHRGEAFGADMAAAAVDTATAHAHAHYSVVVASDAANAAMAEALDAFPTLTHAAKKEFEWVKKEYLACEQMALGKTKEGVIMAIEHPGIAAGSTTVAGIVLFKSNLISMELVGFVVLSWINLSCLHCNFIASCYLISHSFINMLLALGTN